ncbi:MAG: DUF2157 domain-containing protein [Desulfobulbaceae bacterium]|nr:DUF2157 domain-containing protein [Desulfobulbaceae bacterium]
MNKPRRQLIELIEQGTIPEEKIAAALTVVKVTPGGKSWRTFIDHLLLWLGGLALAFAVMFFIAYNWKDIGAFAKFGMVEGFIALAIVVYCKFAENTIASRVSLLVATISLGVLLALYGQTYQTGADTWQLFFNWALLMLPWAIIGRFPAIWIVWVVLMNVSIILYYLTFRGIFGFVFGSESGMLWGVFLFNTLAFIAWQLLTTTWDWLSERWAIRLLALGSGVPLTWLVLFSIFDYREVGGSPGLVWALWLVAMYYIYRKVKLDLFMLAGCSLSAITVTVSFLAKHMLRHGDAGAFLFLAFIVIGMGGGAAIWLKNVHQECLA